MPSIVTNKCRAAEFDIVYRGAAAPANFKLALCTAANVPTEKTNTLGELVEIAVGAGYNAGGITINRNTTDFQTLTEDDTNDKAICVIRDLTLTASGGPIPLIGSGAAFAVLTTPTGDVWRAWDIRDSGGSSRAVSNTQSLLINGLGMEKRKA